MKILNAKDSLQAFLNSQTGKSIKIVSAFAGGTESLISTLIEQGNQIDLLVGTINAFTSPEFIDYCVKQKGSKLKAFVDFRYQASVHWKLYLISPNIVVIGSANLTEIGLSLERDTCVVIENSRLYADYEIQFKNLLKAPKVLRAKSSKEFNDKLEAYRINHDRSQAGMARSKQYLTAADWLADETNQRLPLFIWKGYFTEADEKKAATLLRANSEANDSPALRDTFIYPASNNKLPFSPGDVVLCSGSCGDQIGFFVFDRIIFSEEQYFIYSYRKEKYPTPFSIKPVKTLIKEAIPGLFDSSATHLDRTQLKTILHLP